VGVAQWLEHQVVDLTVAGSNPVAHPKSIWINLSTNFSYQHETLGLFQTLLTIDYATLLW
jgi:hypothetical protein